MQLRLAFNLSRVWQHYEGKRFAIVSAYLMSSLIAINKARAAALKQAVRDHHYGYVEMEGRWVETKGEHRGEELVEYPLFVPNCSYEDAVYFGSGEYFPSAPEPQQAIIYGDGDGILLLESTGTGGWVEAMEFTAIQTNLETAMKRWSDKRQQLRGQDDQGAEDDEYIGWSNYKGKPFRFSSVTFDMPTPPAHPISYVGSMVPRWHDTDARDFADRPRPYATRRK